MLKKILFLFLLCFSMAAKAQVEINTEIDSSINIDENVVIYKDARLDILDKRPMMVAKAEAWAIEEKEKVIPLFKPIKSADGKKTVTGSIYTQKGFRVVIFNGSDRIKALQAKNNFSRAFPGTPSYMSYNVPSYKIKVGNFEDRNEANKFMKKLNAAFPSCFIVPDIVTIKNINVN